MAFLTSLLHGKHVVVLRQKTLEPPESVQNYCNTGPTLRTWTTHDSPREVPFSLPFTSHGWCFQDVTSCLVILFKPLVIFQMSWSLIPSERCGRSQFTSSMATQPTFPRLLGSGAHLQRKATEPRIPRYQCWASESPIDPLGITIWGHGFHMFSPFGSIWCHGFAVNLHWVPGCSIRFDLDLKIVASPHLC